MSKVIDITQRLRSKKRNAVITPTALSPEDLGIFKELAEKELTTRKKVKFLPGVTPAVFAYSKTVDDREYILRSDGFCSVSNYKRVNRPLLEACQVAERGLSINFIYTQTGMFPKG